MQSLFQFTCGQSRGTFTNQPDDGIGESAPFAKSGLTIGPQSVFIELGYVEQRVIAGIAVVAGVIAMLPHQTPCRHG